MTLSPIVMISGIIALIIVFLAIVMPGNAMKFVGQSFMKLVIGALFLFLLNAVGNQFGIHVPINFLTAAISGFLGLPGVAALAMIQLWILV